MANSMSEACPEPAAAGPTLLYHGSNYGGVESIDPHRRRSDGELLCMSASINVARRYGHTITCFEVREGLPVKRISVRDFFQGDKGLPDYHAEGFVAVVLEGDPDCYDFPADSWFILHKSAVKVHSWLNASEAQAKDDGLPFKIEPDGPHDRGWDVWVAEHGEELEPAPRRVAP